MTGRVDHGRDEGAAAVEFALLLIPFVLLVFGIISGGIVFNDKLSLSQGMREAARYGATLPDPPKDAASASTYLNAVLAQAQGNNYGQIGPDPTSVCVGFIPANSDPTKTATSAYYLGYSGAVSSTPCEANAPTTPGTVFVIGKKPASFNLILVKYNTTLLSISAARYEGQS